MSKNPENCSLKLRSVSEIQFEYLRIRPHKGKNTGRRENEYSNIKPELVNLRTSNLVCVILHKMCKCPEKFMPKFDSVFEVQFEYLRIRTQTMKIAIFNDFNLVSSLSCLYVDGAQVFIPEIGLFSQGVWIQLPIRPNSDPKSISMVCGDFNFVPSLSCSNIDVAQHCTSAIGLFSLRVDIQLPIRPNLDTQVISVLSMIVSMFRIRH